MILIFDIVLTDYLKKTVLLKAVKIYVKLSLSKKNTYQMNKLSRCYLLEIVFLIDRPIFSDFSEVCMLPTAVR